MFPYWLLFALAATGAIGLRTLGVTRPDRGLWIVALAALILIGFRFEVGADWDNYLEIFASWAYFDLDQLFRFSDPAYALLNWLAHQLGLGIWAVNLVCGALVVWGLTKFARSQPHPWLAYVVAVPYFLIVVAMGYTRQSAAIGLLLAGLSTVRSGRLLYFFVCVALATAFHRSAIIVVPLVILAFVTRKIFTAALVGLLGILAYFYIFQSVFEQFMAAYVDISMDSQGAAVRVLMNVIPAFLFLLAPRRFAPDINDERLWRIFSLASLACAAVLFASPQSTAIDRVALYLIPLQIVVLSRLPYALATQVGENRIFTLAVIIYTAAIQFVWLNYASHAEYWIPYRFYPLGSETIGIIG